MCMCVCVCVCVLFPLLDERGDIGEWCYWSAFLLTCAPKISDGIIIFQATHMFRVSGHAVDNEGSNANVTDGTAAVLGAAALAASKSISLTFSSGGQQGGRNWCRCDQCGYAGQSTQYFAPWNVLALSCVAFN